MCACLCVSSRPGSRRQGYNESVIIWDGVSTGAAGRNGPWTDHCYSHLLPVPGHLHKINALCWYSISILIRKCDTRRKRVTASCQLKKSLVKMKWIGQAEYEKQAETDMCSLVMRLFLYRIGHLANSWTFCKLTLICLLAQTNKGQFSMMYYFLVSTLTFWNLKTSGQDSREAQTPRLSRPVTHSG